MTKYRKYFELAGLILIWRVVLILIGYFGFERFPLTQIFYSGGKTTLFFKAWANWDGGHYIGIAISNYAHYFQQAFFPLYPLLIKLTAFITQDYFWAAYLVSFIFTYGLVVFLYKLSRLYFDEAAAQRALIYLLIFPSSIFLAAAYSESLFLCLAIGAFYFAKTKRWFPAAIFAGLATATKFIGIFLVAGLIIEWLDTHRFNFRQIFAFKKLIIYPLWLIGAVSGLLLYMADLIIKYNDPLYFLHVENYWHRSTQIVNPLGVLVGGAPNRFFSIQQGLGLLNYTDYYFCLIFLGSAVFIYKRFSKAMGVYTFLVTLFPLFSGTLTSETRYVLAGFPIFILLGNLGKAKLVDYLITMISISLLAIFTVLFINGNWLA